MRKIAITGTSRGLGAALVRKFRSLGHTVVGGARTSAQQLDQDLQEGYFPFQATDPESQHSWWDQVETHLGLPDLVIANAALINHNAPLWEVPVEEFRAVMEANLLGVYLTFREYLQRWHRSEERPRGVLVAISSTWGRTTSPEVAPYCMSKWGVEGMIKSLAQELPPQLSAVALNPGIINTEMLRSCFGSGASHYETSEQWAPRAAEEILAFERSHNGASASIS